MEFFEILMTFDDFKGPFEAPFDFYRIDGIELRGKDLNLRPLGYEPNELPLLHPAV